MNLARVTCGPARKWRRFEPGVQVMRCLMRWFYRVQIFAFFVATFAQGLSTLNAQVNSRPDVIVVDANAPSHPFPHFWEQMFGSGRAVLTLRDSYRRDLREVKQVTDFKYVRFHAIFHDEVGLYDEDGQGRPVYNFSYVDQIYDGLLANGVRPFVELSFMPQKLAAQNALHSFWYKPNVSPPRDWRKWDDLIAVFIRHLIDRYGIDEIAQWYFEVWNEPNLDFWAGEPKQASYWELYDHTARAIKGVNPRLRVGGPATAQAAWWMPLSNIASRPISRSTSSLLMSMPTIHRKMSSGPRRMFHAIKWSAARWIGFTTKSKPQACQPYP